MNIETMGDLARYFFYFTEQERAVQEPNPRAWLIKKAMIGRRGTYNCNGCSFEQKLNGEVRVWFQGKVREGKPDFITSVSELADALIGIDADRKLTTSRPTPAAVGGQQLTMF